MSAGRGRVNPAATRHNRGEASDPRASPVDRSDIRTVASPSRLRDPTRLPSPTQPLPGLDPHLDYVHDALNDPVGHVQQQVQHQALLWSGGMPKAPSRWLRGLADIPRPSASSVTHQERCCEPLSGRVGMIPPATARQAPCALTAQHRQLLHQHPTIYPPRLQPMPADPLPHRGRLHTSSLRGLSDRHQLTVVRVRQSGCHGDLPCHACAGHGQSGGGAPCAGTPRPPPRHASLR